MFVPEAREQETRRRGKWAGSASSWWFHAGAITISQFMSSADRNRAAGGILPLP